MERYTHIPLPVPTEEHRVFDDVRSSFIQWPKIEIILDKPQRNNTADDGTSTEVLPHQIAQSGQVSVTTTVGPSEVLVGISEVLPAPEPTPDRPLVTEEEYSRLPHDLQDLHDHLMSLPEGQNEMIVTVPPEMFVHVGSELYISLKDFKDILWTSSSNRWLDVSYITIFLMKLVHTCEQIVPLTTNLCLFLDPGKLAAATLKLDGRMSTEYLCLAMHYAQADSKKFILVPYHQSGHWCLIVIVPKENTCVIMDSSRPKDNSIKINICKDIFPYVNKAFANYIQEGEM